MKNRKKVNCIQAIKINKLTSFVTIFLCVVVTLCLLLPSVLSSAPIYNHVIVIDAGHGGIDGGSVGVVTKNDENKLNLEYAKCLKNYFEKFSFKVVMTRTNSNGLYLPLANNKKKSDMQERKKIIESAKPDIVVSIHMNAFPLKSSNGALTFHRENDEPSYALAKSIQDQLIHDFENARKTCKGADFFILNCVDCPSVLVECGFLSNPKEDKLLSTESYKEKMCYSIFCGIIAFLGADSI